MIRSTQIISVVLAFVLLPVVCPAADLKLAWDPAPAGETWDRVIAYEKTVEGYVKIAEVTGDKTELTLLSPSPGRHVYVVRAMNVRGESADSNEVSLPPDPVRPSSLRITVTVEIKQ